MGLFQRLTSSFRSLVSGRYSWPGLDITLAGGQQLHLVGSIHMGTPDMAPLPPALLKKLQQADALIVEADISGNETPFSNIPTCPPLRERLSETRYLQLEKMSAEQGLSLALLDSQPLWQVAMVLQATQAGKLGLAADYGIDYQLLRSARAQSKPVIELEGAEQQVNLLRNLPDGGADLLNDTLTHWHTNARLLQVMIGWWISQPPGETPALPNTFSQSLYDVLMQQRNMAWRDRLHQLPPGRYVVAVGALHLYGEGNLPSMLK